jgi:hypothetical protein
LATTQTRLPLVRQLSGSFLTELFDGFFWRVYSHLQQQNLRDAVNLL